MIWCIEVKEGVLDYNNNGNSKDQNYLFIWQSSCPIWKYASDHFPSSQPEYSISYRHLLLEVRIGLLFQSIRDPACESLTGCYNFQHPLNHGDHNP
jgi:hypothetical protein